MSPVLSTRVVLLLFSLLVSSIHAFSVLQPDSSPSAPPTHNKETQTLGLLTFDLDDSLYPIAKVEEEANKAFVKSMAQYGFTGLASRDIVDAAKTIRTQLSQTDPAAAAALTHNDLRLKAIRQEMERITIERKLQACAQEWATTVESLSTLVKENSKKWAKAAVHDNIVRAVSTAWEMERHHSAERHLYPEVLDLLTQIKHDHPTAILGAVTDGRSNPLFMTFTLAPFFDFRCSWEDDQGTARREIFFQQLDSTGGDTEQLQWIYEESRYKYAELKKAADAMKPNTERLVFPATYDDRVWIHVGDDLAFDVGGAAACGAKTIYLELDDKRYGQSARHRYDDIIPSWSTTPSNELKNRVAMAKAAEEKVDIKLNFLSTLPDAIHDILKAGN